MYDKIYESLFTFGYPFKEELFFGVWKVSLGKEIYLIRELYIDKIEEKGDKCEAELIIIDGKYAHKLSTEIRVKKNREFKDKLEKFKMKNNIPSKKLKYSCQPPLRLDFSD